MSIVKTEKIKSPWNITIFINNGYLDDIEIHFYRVVLRECEIGDFVVAWCNRRLRVGNYVRVSYDAINSNSSESGCIKKIS